MLQPITDRTELRTAFRGLSRQFARGITPVQRYLGWQGGRGEYGLYWRDQQDCWGVFESKELKNRYWCCFGKTDPLGEGNQSITCEINFPIRGSNRRIAGMVLRDDEGNIFIGHSGKVGGGRKGIGKNSFLAYWRRENIEDVAWPDGKTTRAIIIGRVGGKRLPLQIAHFVHEVAEFKRLAVESPSKIRHSQVGSTFSPEFSGTKKGYEIQGRIEANCDHGLIIDELVKELRKKKLHYANDRHRDLFVLAKNGKVRCLFEVKTDSSSTSIYQGIGQALYHTALHTPKPRPILVMPGVPDKRTEKVLARLGVEHVSFTWDANRPKFVGLDRATRH